MRIMILPRMESMILPPAFKIVPEPRARVTKTRCDAIPFLPVAFKIFSHPRIESFVLIFIIKKKNYYLNKLLCCKNVYEHNIATKFFMEKQAKQAQFLFVPENSIERMYFRLRYEKNIFFSNTSIERTYFPH